GSLGMLPSASRGTRTTAVGTFGLYEPCHGSAPDIAGQGVANPLATILSVAMLLRYSLGAEDAAVAIENAVTHILDTGLRTADIAAPGEATVSIVQMGDAVIEALEAGGDSLARD
ncbi:MAG: 3-isopropylmalate dehydrogenase, partial [Armatimonadetes bacterium]|nr:3-isopropylmalate dehydrogenase [Armatimonadota bacterium]